jgi:glycerol uptake facilitator-like aquaporin
MIPTLGRRAAAEALGTGLLVMAVVGSGVMATQRSPNDAGLQLLQNAAATAGALVALILAFGWVSGAHFNPAVSLAARFHGSLNDRELVSYVVAQVVGACMGTMTANVMFELPVVAWSTTDRSSPALWFSEVIATIGLLLVINGCVRSGGASVPYAVGAWIGGAYWFTSSTSFANPAVTIARTLTDSFAGISWSSVPMFLAAQLIGALVALGLIRFVFTTRLPDALS